MTSAMTSPDRRTAARLRAFIAGWAGTVALAETLAVGTAAVAATTWEAIAAATLAEALLLAAGQRFLLRRTRPGLEARWFLATVAGTLAGRAIHYALDPSLQSAAGRSVAAQAALGAALGALSGAVMALPQAYVLADRIARRAWWWIAGRAVAWCLGFSLLMLAAAQVAVVARLPLASMLAAMIAGFAAIMALVGLVEGVVLARLLGAVVAGHEAPPRRRGHPSEHAIVVSRVIACPAATVAAMVGDSRGAGDADDPALAYRAAYGAIELSIASDPPDPRAPEFDGRLRIDEVDAAHARLVVVGRFAHRDDVADEAHRGIVERRLCRALERLAERVPSATPV
ncbi:MAG TPA: hypothetical protein VFB22_10415 [Candidatus Baltobacteraceae bacterium]|nr:hypothetical protein [Candidatus Baltobacteraceae bacterium]